MLKEIKIKQEIISEVAPWTMKIPEIDLSITKYEKNTEECKIKYEIIETNQNCIAIYTDGSKKANSTSSAVGIPSKKHTILQHLPQYASIYTAELTAIEMALNYIIRNNNTKYIIFTDSLSSLIAIKHHRPNNPLIIVIQNLIHQNIITNNNNINKVWVPSHIGIKENEKADTAANLAHGLPISNIPIPFTDIKTIIKGYTNSLWQQGWNETKKFLKISTPKIPFKELKNINMPRLHQTVVNKIKIGHTKITHSWILEKIKQKNCETCRTKLTVHHIILECIKYSDQRKRHNIPTNMQEVVLNQMNI
ncbi:hypothetical protein HELRODRAFT_167922 [Helobdella robusta]|uniref:ribonuclease H n=1 Tax=Helobdella robusta TaxID=6412 RepID=T1EZY8_HELRO|nr:hypothetical protein HELRODRAFT_167922 [Helobdella robusta]ESO10075.1 hypothetical protein HELRODRAFT_167922 [Helobdella robusta]